METLLQRILDRYEVDELVELLNLSVSDLYEAFEDRIVTLREEGLLDVD